MISPGTNARQMAAFLLHFSRTQRPDHRAGPKRSMHHAGAVHGRRAPRTRESTSNFTPWPRPGHHQYHIDDFAAMVALWNSRWSPQICPEQITGIGLTRGGEQYCRVHEDNIVGDAPYCQLAIEYEIELLPVEFGPSFVNNCTRVLGPDILQCMTFVTSHVEFDVGHTEFNAHLVGTLIDDAPERLPMLVAAGTSVLEAFADHLTECWQLAESLAKAE